MLMCWKYQMWQCHMQKELCRGHRCCKWWKTLRKFHNCASSIFLCTEIQRLFRKNMIEEICIQYRRLNHIVDIKLQECIWRSRTSLTSDFGTAGGRKWLYATFFLSQFCGCWRSNWYLAYGCSDLGWPPEELRDSGSASVLPLTSTSLTGPDLVLTKLVALCYSCGAEDLALSILQLWDKGKLADWFHNVSK